MFKFCPTDTPEKYCGLKWHIPTMTHVLLVTTLWSALSKLEVSFASVKSHCLEYVVFIR